MLEEFIATGDSETEIKMSFLIDYCPYQNVGRHMISIFDSMIVTGFEDLERFFNNGV